MNKTIQNLVAALFFLALGVFWLVNSYAIKVSAAAESFGTTPRTVPQIVSVLLILLALSLIVEQLFRMMRARGQADAHSRVEGPPVWEALKRFLGVAAVLAVSVLYCIFIGTLTYLPATVILMAALAWCFEIRRPLPLILISTVTPTLLFVIFRFLLVVPLP